MSGICILSTVAIDRRAHSRPRDACDNRFVRRSCAVRFARPERQSPTMHERREGRGARRGLHPLARVRDRGLRSAPPTSTTQWKRGVHMPVALLQPGVYIEEVPSGVRTITGVATSIALFIGWAPRGPVDRALRLTSFADYERAYGGPDSRSLLGYSVRHFYDNGGSDAYILRIADAATMATAAGDIGDLHIPASSPGAWGANYSVRLTRRPDDATRFRIDVIQPSANNAVLETFANLSMTATDARFAPAIINRHSAFIDN